MGLNKNSFGVDISGIGARFSSPAINNALQQQENIRRMLEPALSVSAILRQREQLMHMIEPPAVFSTLVGQQNRLLPAISSPMIEAAIAYQNLIAEQGLSFSKTFAENINLSQLNSLSPSISSSVTFAFENRVHDLAMTMGKSLEACIPKCNEMAANLTQALERSLPQFTVIGEIAYKLGDSIPQIGYAVTSFARQTANSIGAISLSMQSSLSSLFDALERIRIPNYDHFVNSFNYISDFKERNELLKSFGWYLISELPEDIVDAIYERRDEITQEEVDSLIVRYFREKQCSALKQIVNNWVDIPCFESRKEVFHQAQVCHSRRTFNASTTLVSIHFEGVITDFVRARLPRPTNPNEEKEIDKQLRCKNALSSISELANDLPMEVMKFTDWMICSFILECIDAAFNANFSPTNPDNCPNSSRHKIAHGHATAKETEANSLRRFLFMNELYKLFYRLDNEYQLAS